MERLAAFQGVNAQGTARLHSANLCQLFACLRHRAVVPGWETGEGVLLYPRTGRDFAPEFTTHGHRIRALTPDLFQPWEAIERDLLRVAITAPRDGAAC